MRNRLRFSIATMLLLTIACALVSKWFVSTIEVPQERVEEWTEMGILASSIALVEASYPEDRWALCAIASGEGYYCHLSEGVHFLGTTGGSYFSLGVQLPIDLSDGWSTELKNIAERPDGKVRRLVPGEIVAMQFGNPTCWKLASGSDVSMGTLTVLKINNEHATIKVAAKIPLRGMIETESEVVLEIDRTFELDIMWPEDPLAVIPRKSRVSKR